MSNPQGHPNIINLGIRTRFGAPSRLSVPSCSSPRPWSIRKAVRRLASCKLPIAERYDLSTLLRVIGPNPTLADLIAVSMFFKALNGNVDAMQALEVMLDGPLPS